MLFVSFPCNDPMLSYSLLLFDAKIMTQVATSAIKKIQHI